QIREFEGRKLPRADVDVVSEHIWHCDLCYQAFLSVLERRFPLEIDFDDLAGLKGRHLEGRDLTDFVGRTMTDLDFQYAALHVQDCAQCRQTVSQAADRQLYYISSEESAPEQPASTRRWYLPSLASDHSFRWQLPLAAALVIAVALILWSVLNLR